MYKDGYRPLEFFIAQEKNNKNTLNDKSNKTILLAPSWGSKGTLEVCGIPLIEHLLNSDHLIYLRPHPMTLKHNQKLILEIKNIFQNNKNFILQDDLSNKEIFFQADMLITDWSGVAMEYSFGRLKPVLFINVPQKMNNPESHLLNIEPIEKSIRNKIGEIIHPDELDCINKVIDGMFKREKMFLEDIEFLRKKSVFNLGHSLEKASSRILKIANATRKRNVLSTN